MLFDLPMGGLAFGDVLTEPLEYYYGGSRVKVRFVGANPRNNMRLDETYLAVERLADNGTSWQLQATDANWETMLVWCLDCFNVITLSSFERRFIWTRNRTLLGTSEVTIIWDIPPQTEPGVYRIRYFGDYKNFVQQIVAFEGTTKSFRVRSLEDFENEISSLAASSPSLFANIPALSMLRRLQLQQKSAGG